MLSAFNKVVNDFLVKFYDDYSLFYLVSLITWNTLDKVSYGYSASSCEQVNF